MSTANLDSADLKNSSGGGSVREDVMKRVWQVDNIPLPFTDRIKSGTADQEYTEWTIKELAAVDLNNAVVDGADVTGNNTKTGIRQGNHCQESIKVVRVSDRAVASDTIIYDNELAGQLADRQKEEKRDIEGISLSQQASVADDGNTIAGKSAGLGAWLITNISAGATGAHPGFQAGTKLVTAPTPGTKRALTEALLDSVTLSVYNNGGDEDNRLAVMMRPPVKTLISDYAYGNTAKIAALQRQVSGEQGQAIGSIDMWRTDFGYLELVPNRLQPVTAAATSTVFFINFDYVELAFLHGIYVKPLATTGLAENRLIAADWTLKVLNEKAHGAVFDVDEAAVMTA
jgi:hypothetical protein